MSEPTINTDVPVTFSETQRIKIRRLVEEGMKTLMEIDTLREGLSETVKACAEELNIKPAPLRRAIKIAHKASLGEENKNHDVVNTILEAAGRTL